jgi:hypothetical protein
VGGNESAGDDFFGAKSMWRDKRFAQQFLHRQYSQSPFNNRAVSFILNPNVQPRISHLPRGHNRFLTFC